VNTPADDFARCRHSKETGLFRSSNRAGGRVPTTSTCTRRKSLKLVTFSPTARLLGSDDKGKQTTLPVAGANVTVTSANGQRQTAVSGPDPASSA
jgi:hypothetical protein